MTSTRRTQSKWIHGPGGAPCPCCREGDRAEAKRRHRRTCRRQARHVVTAEAATHAGSTPDDVANVTKGLPPGPSPASA